MCLCSGRSYKAEFSVQIRRRLSQNMSNLKSHDIVDLDAVPRFELYISLRTRSLVPGPSEFTMHDDYPTPYTHVE